MDVASASDITRTITQDRIRAAEQHRLVRLARRARKEQAAAEAADLTASGVRRTAPVVRFGH